MSAIDSLSKILDGPDGLRSRFGGAEIAIIRNCIAPGDFITRNAIDSLLHRSLLRWPYFSVFKEGVKPALGELTESRSVNGRISSGYASVGVSRHLDNGATLKLNQVEDWHRGTRDLLRGIEAALPVEAKAFVFLTPQDNTGMLPHRDGSHVLVIQLEGRKEWHLYDPGVVPRSDSGLDVDITTPPRIEVLEPGDVMYLPHGYPHAATAVGGWSLHLTYTLTEPTPQALVRAVVDSWLSSPAGEDLAARSAGLTPERRVGEVSESVAALLDTLDDATVVQNALATMRGRRVT
ncbi:JmjC domain-containing protein [Streptomyces sp. WM6378]|uniref:JmjC domain-containing protein n=1 Tax=Streptomyces sp. WM6378 TaxID=1415557 RepID=UPI00099C80C1|nr:cupin domain-containing protein [Streptomyces sp. WM6378]